MTTNKTTKMTGKPVRAGRFNWRQINLVRAVCAMMSVYGCCVEVTCRRTIITSGAMMSDFESKLTEACNAVNAFTVVESDKIAPNRIRKGYSATFNVSYLS